MFEIPTAYTPKQKFFRGSRILYRGSPAAVIGSFTDLHGGFVYSDEEPKYSILCSRHPVHGTVLPHAWVAESELETDYALYHGDGERVLQYYKSPIRP